MNWVPEHMKSRMINWADSMEWDWCISRQRLFATPIPVWYCKDCDKIILPEIEDLPVDPTQDKPKHTCECGCEEFIPEEDVLDTWMDSSVSPLSIADWPNKGFEDIFPSNIRPQGHDIIRTWAFYTTLRCLALTGKKPFDDIVINGMVFGEDGYKMSKSRGNVIGSEDVIAKYGADSLRTWAANSVPGSDVMFDWKDIKHGYRFLRKFWNAFRFISMQIFDEEVPYDEAKDSFGAMDKWILAKLNKLNIKVDNAFANYEYADTISSIEKFVWHDFCDEYIEAVKYRLYNDDVGDKSRRAAKYTLRCVIETSLKFLSPIVPFFAEEVYQHFSDTSIHKESWPEVNESLLNDVAVENGDLTVDLIDEVRRFKSASKIPLNAQLAEVNVYTSDEKLIDVFNEFNENILGTLKIDELSVKTGRPEVHEKIIEIEGEMSQIGPKFKKDAGKIIGYLKSTPIDEIAENLNINGQLDINGLIVDESMLNIKKDIVGASGKKIDILQSETLDIIVEVIR